jgi:hypothetical protein
MIAPPIAFPGYLLSLEQTGCEDLRIVIEERTGRGAPRVLPYAPEIGPSREIIPAATDRVLNVYWPRIVSFATRGDAFAKREPGEKPVRETLIERTIDDAFSRFVRSSCNDDANYVATVTGRIFNGEQETPVRFWQIICNECIIDVAAQYPPRISVRPTG